MELLNNGDLRSHLLKERSDSCLKVNDHKLLSYCRQIANGMDYLSSKAFVHRDLAARNILTSARGQCKVRLYRNNIDYVEFFLT